MQTIMTQNASVNFEICEINFFQNIDKKKNIKFSQVTKCCLKWNAEEKNSQKIIITDIFTIQNIFIQGQNKNCITRLVSVELLWIWNQNFPSCHVFRRLDFLKITQFVGWGQR